VRWGKNGLVKNRACQQQLRKDEREGREPERRRKAR
jgi:hypothetical protein